MVICGNDVSFNKLEFNSVVMNGHILPNYANKYDLGNAEYKIRHLFLSDNSLWLGDSHKIDISGGRMRFRKRNLTLPPSKLHNFSGYDEEEAKSLTGNANIEDFTLQQWEFMRDIFGMPIHSINNMFDSRSRF